MEKPDNSAQRSIIAKCLYADARNKNIDPKFNENVRQKIKELLKSIISQDYPILVDNLNIEKYNSHVKIITDDILNFLRDFSQNVISANVSEKQMNGIPQSRLPVPSNLKNTDAVEEPEESEEETHPNKGKRAGSARITKQGRMRGSRRKSTRKTDFLKERMITMDNMIGLIKLSYTYMREVRSDETVGKWADLTGEPSFINSPFYRLKFGDTEVEIDASDFKDLWTKVARLITIQAVAEKRIPKLTKKATAVQIIRNLTVEEIIELVKAKYENYFDV